MKPDDLTHRIGLRHDSYWLRRLAYLGARYGSPMFMRHGSTVIGALFSGVLVGYRRTVLGNLRRIHGSRPAWQEQLDVTKTFTNYASCLTEALGLERMAPESISYELLGQGHLESVLNDGSGFIVATAHVGAWDCAALHLERMTNRPVVVVMEREANSAAGQFQDTIRTRTGVEIAHVGDHPFEGLKLLKHLKNGGIIAVQLDRRPPSARTLLVNLFQTAFAMPVGPFQLSSLASVPVLPVYCARIGFYRYQLRVSPPIHVRRRASSNDLKQAAQLAADALAEFLRVYPTQWFLFEQAESLQ